MDKIKSKELLWGLLPLFVLFVTWGKRMAGATYAQEVLSLFILVAAIKLVGYLNLSVQDYSIMLSILLLVKMKRFFGYMTDSSLLLLFYALLCIFVKLRMKKLRGNGFAICLSFTAALITYYLYQWIYSFLFYRIYQYFQKHYQFTNFYKLVSFFLLFLLLVLCSAFLLMLVRKIFHRFFEKLDSFTGQYWEIERAVLILLGFSLLEFAGTQLNLDFVGYQTQLLSFVQGLVVILIIVTQFFYLYLLIRTVSIKEELKFQEGEKQNLLLYNQNLEENLEKIRGVKHDMKNVFLTMGGFVEQSGNSEMKAFYQEHIIPFAQEEIKKNDLYIQLMSIPNEGFRSFLYYKMLQGVEHQVSMELENHLQGSEWKEMMNYTDLVRIMGILLDNAMEEAVETVQGKVLIKLKEDEKELNFVIENSIRESMMQKGILPGTTSKGLGRGNGLLIVEKIMARYKNVILNTYYKEGKYAQCLVIVKK